MNFIFLLFLTISAIANNSSAITIAAPECACRPEVHDKYENPIRFASGPNAGKCVNSCRFRSATILEQNENSILVTNLLHEKKYWLATIPVKEIEEVDMGFDEFRPFVAHTFLRFRFSKNTKIILQSQESKEKRVINDLVLSVEGVPAKGQHYSVINGLRGNMLITYRLLSMVQTTEWLKKELKHSVQIYRLNLNAAEQQNALITGLQNSKERSFRGFYELLTNNCATTLIELVTNAKGIESGIPLFAPFGTLHFLKKLGMVGADADSRLPDLQ